MGKTIFRIHTLYLKFTKNLNVKIATTFILLRGLLFQYYYNNYLVLIYFRSIQIFFFYLQLDEKIII